MSKDTTRDRILAAASEEFSARGYEKTTVRDICARADVNVAAINYHFRDKQNLFYKVLSHWSEEFVRESGIHEKIAAAQTPEAKLRAYIRSGLEYSCASGDPDGVRLNRVRLTLQELASEDHDPEVFSNHEELEAQLLAPTVKALIGTDDPAIVEQACRAASSISTYYILLALNDKKHSLQTREDLEATADFLTTFALSGLNAIKEKHHA